MFPPIIAPFTKIGKDGTKFGCFWGEQSFLSNFFHAPFKFEGKNFCSNEQFYQYHKAEICNNLEVANLILKTKNPKTIKRLSHRINANNPVFQNLKIRIMRRGLREKFTQNKALKIALLQTKKDDFHLVEASPTDKFWGCGLATNDEKICNKNEWPGQNMLGELLMTVRDEIAFYCPN